MSKYDLDLLVTLSPSMPHFPRFAKDGRLAGVRINSAMMYADELDGELAIAKSIVDPVPLYFDVKGRQLRIKEVHACPTHLEITLNHRISVDLPTVILFKAGEDSALLTEIKNDGRRLVFSPGPKYTVKEGESICIRHPSFKILDKTFPDYEIERIKKVVGANAFKRWVLSYVESQRDVDEFREYIGDDELVLKIENQRGLAFVANDYKPQKNATLMAARGDLYIEVPRPHDILNAMRLIIAKDPKAMVGSRILLSCTTKEVPDAVDFSELAWLYDIGYRRMLLCDDLCIEEHRLARAINAFEGFRNSYVAEEYAVAQEADRRIQAPKKKSTLDRVFWWRARKPV